VKDTSVLVVAPHCDDEVLGVGGTMARWAEEGAKVTVAILTRGFPPLTSEEENAKEQIEIVKAHQMLGVRETVHLGFRAAALSELPHRELNGALLELYQRVKPDVPRNVLAYETLSETNWYAPLVTPGFIPNTFIDISNHLEIKLQALAAYESQVRKAPNERSIETLRALATLRGSTVHLPAAEAFISVRALI
jgi:LmbE family N-acetylglucosaminyl deacetylase